VSRFVNGSFKPVIKSPKVVTEAWVTNHRVIVRVKNFDKQGWTADRSLGAMVWGSGIETVDFLASKAYHRIKSRGQAMIGHIYMPWIRAIAYQPRIGTSQVGAVRLQIAKKLVDGGTSDLFLSILLNKTEDPKEVAEDILERCTTWWLTHDTRLSEMEREKFEQAADSDFKVPEPGKVWTVTLPYFRYTSNSNFSAPHAGGTKNVIRIP
jgi:hypothetical protein